MTISLSVKGRGRSDAQSHLVSIEFSATHDPGETLKALAAKESGLTESEARRRLKRFGRNEVAPTQTLAWYKILYRNAKDPLTILLFALGVISALTGDLKATTLIVVMLVLSVVMRFVQEMRADKAAERLKAMVRTTVTVLRDGHKRDMGLEFLVPGDIVHLCAGDMVPADVRLLASRDLYVNQASLTGESMPAEKHAPALSIMPKELLDLPNFCFMGTNVSSGTATAVVVGIGASTKFGAIARAVAGQAEEPTSFDKGVDRYAWLMIRFVAVMVPAVFLINGIARHDWVQAFLFAVAVAVGLTPELLPMIVTVNLSKGALDMSRKKVIVKRLNAIQDFGAMDVLCTDKTGTLTEGRVTLIRHVDMEGNEDDQTLEYAYLNSFYQTGLNNLLDEAVVGHDGVNGKDLVVRYEKIDEIPFDFRRRRMSVVVKEPDGKHLLICKGAVEEVLAACETVEYRGNGVPVGESHLAQAEKLAAEMNAEGFRLIALAIRRLPATKTVYSAADESGMTLIGFLAFLDPPKESAVGAIAELERHGIAVKILTGDNDAVTRAICVQVGYPVNGMLLGSDIEGMDELRLAEACERTTIFCKLDPAHKERVIRAIKSKGHVVGFLGDGINDAPALKAADVGISVSEAADIAKESSDIILTERSLLVLRDGVVEGRRAFGNIVKYVKMTGSSNFGNMFSVVGGSMFLPFLPMLPLQVIANNLLYDLSQASIPTDAVDAEYLRKPRQWNITRIRQFILWIGPVSSLFDYATYALMLYVFHCWADPALFHTGWFVESLFTQTLIIHVIRTNKIPFLQSRASVALTASTFFICAIAAWLPYSPAAPALGFVPLPLAYWAYLAVFVVTYFVLAQAVKTLFIRKYGWD